MRGAKSGFVEHVVIVIGLRLFFDDLADLLKDALHALHHFLVECLIAALEELAALTVKCDAFLLLHLPVFEKGLLLGIVDRRILDLLFETSEGGFQLADAGEAFVVVFLNASALYVNLLLSIVRAVILLEKLLHVHGCNLKLALLSSSHGDEGCGESHAEKTSE